jgi:hypothetical protein
MITSFLGDLRIDLVLSNKRKFYYASIFLPSSSNLQGFISFGNSLASILFNYRLQIRIVEQDFLSMTVTWRRKQSIKR